MRVARGGDTGAGVVDCGKRVENIIVNERYLYCVNG